MLGEGGVNLATDRQLCRAGGREGGRVGVRSSGAFSGYPSVVILQKSHRGHGCNHNMVHLLYIP